MSKGACLKEPRKEVDKNRTKKQLNVACLETCQEVGGGNENFENSGSTHILQLKL